MGWGEHSAGLCVRRQMVPIAEQYSSMPSIKFLFILALWTLSLDLDAAVATSTLKTSTSRMNDLQGIQPESTVDHKRQSMDLEEEIEENGQVFEVQASNVQRAGFHQRLDIARKDNKGINPGKPFHSQAPEFSGGDRKMYSLPVTNQEIVDNVKGESDKAIIADLDDRPVKRQMSSRAKSSLIGKKHISNLDDHILSNLEADKMILQPVDGFNMLDTNDGAGPMSKQLMWKKKAIRPQQLQNGHTDDDSRISQYPWRNDPHYRESVKRKHPDADCEYTKRLSQNNRNSGDATMSKSSKLGGAGHHEIVDSYDNAKADAEEVVLTEEREEDKKLIPDYNLGEPIKDWNQKRQKWAREHPEVKQEQLFILTGTQPTPCHNAEGDHLLLRCFKNKVDYSRIHGVGLFYNTALLDAHMPSFWAKLPVVRATMLAHPEVEWIWWLDADAIITDMEFSIPLHRYSAYNLVVHGWESLVFEKRSWLGLNAGSFLLRNCQWSLDLLERWSSMGPKAPMGDAYRHILSDFLPDRAPDPTDDQAALVFLLIKERQRWAGKLRVELDFFLSGYWLELMDGFEAIEERYRAMEEQHAELWELLEWQGTVGKEKLVAEVGRAREQHLLASGVSVQQRRAFITHFTGCQPCSGHHNTIYSTEQCHSGLLRALNYADDQVLRTLGFRHRTLHLSDVFPTSSFSPERNTGKKNF